MTDDPLKKIESLIVSHDKQISELKRIATKLDVFLEGAFGNDGFVALINSRVQRLEEKVDKLWTRQNMIIGGILVINVLLTVAVKFLHF